MTRPGLTYKQKQALEFITGYMTSHDVPPTFEEIKAALGLKSKSGVHRIVNGLVERRYLVRIPNRSRALGLVSEAQSDKYEIETLKRDYRRLRGAATKALEVMNGTRYAGGVPEQLETVLKSTIII